MRKHYKRLIREILGIEGEIFEVIAVDGTGFGHDAWERIKGKMGRKVVVPVRDTVHTRVKHPLRVQAKKDYEESRDRCGERSIVESHREDKECLWELYTDE